MNYAFYKRFKPPRLKDIKQSNQSMEKPFLCSYNVLLSVSHIFTFEKSPELRTENKNQMEKKNKTSEAAET